MTELRDEGVSCRSSFRAFSGFLSFPSHNWRARALSFAAVRASWSACWQEPKGRKPKSRRQNQDLLPYSGVKQNRRRRRSRTVNMVGCNSLVLLTLFTIACHVDAFNNPSPCAGRAAGSSSSWLRQRRTTTTSVAALKEATFGMG